MSNLDIVNSILAGGRVINREKRMNDTLQVMADNRGKKEDEKARRLAESADSLSTDSGNRGYGQGRKMGD
ncbi:hypothetical protein N9878_01070 [bacterium]|nr:hypothetical protein [bacterium]